MALWIGRISSETRTKDLLNLFDSYGKILRCDIKTGFAFVEFEDDRDAGDCLHELNGVDLLGHRIVIEWAKGRRRGPSDHQDKDFNRDKCFRCGREGHWARNCPNSPHHNRRSRSPGKRHRGGRNFGSRYSRSYSRSKSRSRSPSPRKSDRHRHRSYYRSKSRSRSPRKFQNRSRDRAREHGVRDRDSRGSRDNRSRSRSGSPSQSHSRRRSNSFSPSRSPRSRSPHSRSRSPSRSHSPSRGKSPRPALSPIHTPVSNVSSEDHKGDDVRGSPVDN